MEGQTDPDQLVVPAATLVTFRRSANGQPPELLMVTRSKQMSFAGGAAVFPGGRIDPADFELAQALDHPALVDELAARIAAVRETLEETGLAVGLLGNIDAASAADARAMLHEIGALAPVLDRFGWSLDPDMLVPFARWLPKGIPERRIFDTRFYLADIGTGAVDIAVDQTENTQLFWSSAADALAMAERGDISVIFPTKRNLERLAQFGSFAEAKAQAEAIPVQTITPWWERQDGEDWLTIPADAGYPVTREGRRTMRRG